MRSGRVIAATSSIHLRMPVWVKPAFSLITLILLANASWFPLAATVAEAVVGRRQRRQNRCDLRSRGLVPRGQHQRLAEMCRILVNREARPLGGDLEEHAARLAEVDRLEPE